MIPLFLGLTTANLILLTCVFVLGLLAMDGGRPTGAYGFHIALAIAAGMMVLLCHIGIYMYFMATARWLEAASNKAGLALGRYVLPARKRKSRAFAWGMGAMLAAMAAMFAGAAADPTVRPWWPGEVHLALALGCIFGNMLAAGAQYRLIRDQGGLMDDAIAAVTGTATVPGG